MRAANEDDACCSRRKRQRPLRVGDLVEVRTLGEISAALDDRGETDGVPFMPEMLAFCGKRFEVWRRADKTCDEAAGGAIRRLTNTVHLKELRCSGQSHGGCDSGCLLFWKEGWLKLVDPADSRAAEISVGRTEPAASDASSDSAGLALAAITRATSTCWRDPEGDRERYSCQATEIGKFSSPLHWWDLRQYVRDLWSRNVGLSEFLEGILIGVVSKFQQFAGGRSVGAVSGRRLAEVSLSLLPGDLVQVKSREEIRATLDERGKSSGLAFPRVMASYCGEQHRVARQVRQFIDPRSGKMIAVKGDAFILDGVVCTGKRRRFCPRAVYPFWRNIWLKAVPQAEATGSPAEQLADGREMASDAEEALL